MPNAVAWLRRLQPVFWDILWHLSLLCPFTHCVEISALVFCVEVHKGGWQLVYIGLEPDLTEDTDINSAHELLPYDIEAVR